jgi:hypothetical protein
MRSLGSIRARVERLASVSLLSPETLIVHWKLPVERCSSCVTDLEAPAHELAVTEALDGHRLTSMRRTGCAFGPES